MPLKTAACLATMVFIAFALVFFIAFDTILSIAHTVWAHRAAKRRPALYREPHTAGRAARPHGQRACQNHGSK